MSLSAVEQIANAVLYEGYILYPYRASAVKNQQRWNFGVLTPKTYSIAQNGTEAWQMQTECLVSNGDDARVRVKLRFLHLVHRQIYKLATPTRQLQDQTEAEPVPELTVDGRSFATWQEAIAREIETEPIALTLLEKEPRHIPFRFPESEEREVLRESEGQIVGFVKRKHEPLDGIIELRANPVGKLSKLRVTVSNVSELADADSRSRDEALSRSLASAHAILQVTDASFLSLLDPPREFKQVAAECQNLGVWPVLAGDETKRDVMLASPIILYDFPQIAAESAGELCDGTEIDEILTLRIMTLTEDEKREMRATDEKARQILERTEALPVEQLWKMHGVLRTLK